MRVVKEAEERKNEILDVAQELFASKGFDHTSTNDILEKVGIARGTLYYHFKSKEEILDSLIERMTGDLMANASRIANDKSLPLLARFTLSIKALNVDTSIGNEVMEQVHKPQNALMHQKMQDMLLSGICPIISELVREGNNEGLFNVEFPEEMVAMTMLYANVAFDSRIDEPEEVTMRKMMAFVTNVEKLLGCKKGLMQEAIMKMF
ncbi:MAG: TetR/AcrR family transcriptional regulator [Lachnospiraceae bacterium]|nr:TetR/AcrR family transcriptional regulator [Lachnospiraceae bacterium]